VPERELILVMPVYNEQDCIAAVIHSWHSALDREGIDFELLVLDDGSRDDTAQVLAGYARRDRVTVIEKPNSGHGPTILGGYREAATRTRWVFQCDSDDEMDPSHFRDLWAVRDAYDFVIGTRVDREQSAGRALISAVSRFVVRAFYGAGVRDVNSPYRLMRAEWLDRIVSVIPADTFAPNLMVSGAFAGMGARICNLPVPHRPRATGTVSIASWRLWRCSAKSLWQTVTLAPRIRGLSVAAAASEGRGAAR